MTLHELGMILCFGTAAFLFGGIARSTDTPAAETAKVSNKPSTRVNPGLR